MKFLKIGELAKRSEVGIETIRFYERQGLLAEPERRPSGYRQYDESVVSRLQFIRHAKELGFTLSEIKELLGLWFDVNTKCVHVRQRAEQKITDIEDKIRSLQRACGLTRLPMFCGLPAWICGCVVQGFRIE